MDRVSHYLTSKTYSVYSALLLKFCFFIARTVVQSVLLVIMTKLMEMANFDLHVSETI